MSNEIVVDDGSPLLDREGMLYKELPSDFRQIRYFALLLVQAAPPETRELNLLEQQVSEIIKNAVKHGNRCQIEKKVRVWYSFSRSVARLIVQDEGPGFLEIDRWNEFNRKRTACLTESRFDELASYVSFRSEASDDSDGGNAMFAALEYWNGGVVFSGSRNCVAVMKRFASNHREVGEEGA